MSTKKLTRREFAGAIAAAATAPTLLAAQEKKPAAPEGKPAAQSGDDESQAMKRIREFVVPEGAEPAFAFRASGGK
ncbi:MAG TPA: hypothetical protein VLB32_02605 [Candidatus Acidoferrales bacterium]|nr:hypothetical protein [Candidatus Acidoferrales bacterium]